MSNKKIYVYCHMTDDLEGCRGGGWTLVMKIDGTKVSRLSSFLLVSQMFALEKTFGTWLVHEKSYQTFVQQKVKPFLDLIIMHTTRSNRYLQYNCRSYLPFVPPYHELPWRDRHYFSGKTSWTSSEVDKLRSPLLPWNVLIDSTRFSSYLPLDSTINQFYFKFSIF